MTFRPERRELVQTLSMATNTLLHAMEAINRVFPTEELERILKSGVERWQNLEQRDAKIT